MSQTLRQFVFRRANAVLGSVGLELQRATLDFDSRLVNASLVARMISQLSEAAEAYFSKQNIFEAKVTDVRADVEFFYGEYLSSPFRGRWGGSRFNNLLWLFLIARAYSPTVIVDSGTYHGASAWALSLGMPAAKLYSFDIDLTQLRKRVKAEYIEADWWSHRFTEDLSRGLCYFDDHVDQARRLLEAAEVGFPVGIFDDDFPITSFAEMAHGGASLPKIEFVLDDALRDETEVEWISGGARNSWTVDRDYLDRARAVIADTERLPNTSLVTGIHQTPYRIVKLKQPC